MKLQRSDCFFRSGCWQPIPGKQLYYITSAAGGLLFAGLRDEWRNPDSGERIASCTVIVTAANDLTRTICDRMTVLLAEPNIEPWLAASAAGLELLWSAPNDCMGLRLVSRACTK